MRFINMKYIDDYEMYEIILTEILYLFSLIMIIIFVGKHFLLGRKLIKVGSISQ